MRPPDIALAPGERERVRVTSLVLILTIIALHQAGTGLIYSAIPVSLAADRNPAWVVGFISTAWSLGFIAGCIVAPDWIRRIGARRAIVVFALTTAAAAAILSLSRDVIVWSAARCISGFSNAVLFSLIEALLGALATTRTRALAFGLYMLISRIMLVAGQLALVWVDPRWSGLFLIAAVAYLLTPLPVIAVTAKAPALRPSAKGRLLELPRQAPAAAVAVMAHGIITVSGPSLFPVYGVAAGMSVEWLAIVLATIQFGGLVLQIPLTILSDRIGRRIVMSLLAAVTAAASVALLIAPLDHPVILLAIAALWGGAPSVLYSVAAAHANDIAEDSQRVEWASSLLLNWGIGAILGPLIASSLMDWRGPHMLFVFTAALSTALLVYLVWRKLVRRRTAGRKPAHDIAGRTPGPR